MSAPMSSRAGAAACRRRAAVVLLVGMGTLTAGCRDSVSPADPPAGNYMLRTVNGLPLPYLQVWVREDKIEIVEGHLSLAGDGTCSSSIRSRITHGSAVSTRTAPDSCTWTNDPDTVRFTWQNGTENAGAWVGDTLSIDDQGLFMRFER